MGDHPEIAFVQASGFTRGRPDGPPLWIVVHDMEADELPTTAENTAAYFAGGAGGRDVSSHYCADSDSVVQCVLLADTAWTVGNRPGNNRGINWELAGYASQTREQWLDPFGLAMFARMAPIVRADAAAYGIPLERRTVEELRTFKAGVTSHNDLRLAFGVTDHTDPGPNFPWDVFLEIMNGDEMSAESEMWTYNAVAIVTGIAEGADTVTNRYAWTGDGHQLGDEFTKSLAPYWARLAEMGGGAPSQEQVNAALRAALLDPAVAKVFTDAAFAGAQRAERE
jgi:hypothetical protein